VGGTATFSGKTGQREDGYSPGLSLLEADTGNYTVNSTATTTANHNQDQ
jgi:hypothetical protein